MFKIILYGIGFFVATLLFQCVLHKIRKNKNQGQSAIWVGCNAAILICIIGINRHDVNYLGAVLGFLVADEIGKQMGWH